MAGKSDVKAGSAFVELFVKGAKFEVGLRKASRQLKSFGDGLTSIGVKIAAIGTAGLTSLGVAVMHFAESGDELGKMALRTGMTVKALSELRYAAGQSGSSLAAVEKASKKSAAVLHDAATGGKAAAASLKEVGLSVADLIDLSPDERFATISAALSKIEDAGKKSALAQKLFGKSGTELLPMLAEGEKGMAALRLEAEKLGVTMGQEDADAATALGDSFDRVKAAVSGIANAIGSALAPILTDLADDIAYTVATVSTWIKANKDLVIGFAKAVVIVTAIGGAIAALGLTVKAAGFVLGGLATAFGAVLSTITFLLTPFGAIAAAVVAFGAAIVYATGLVPKLIESLKPLGGAIAEIAKSLMTGDFKKAWDVAAASIKFVASVALDWFVSLPELAGYAAGAVARAIIDGLSVVWEWVKSMPSLIDEMLFGSGDIGDILSGSMAAALAKIKSTADAMKAGWRGDPMPELGSSERTKRLREALEDMTGVTTTASGSQQGQGGGKSLHERYGPLPPKTGGKVGDGPVTVTFSAAALISQAMGGGGKTKPEDKIVAALKADLLEAKKMTKIMAELLDKAREGRLVFR